MQFTGCPKKSLRFNFRNGEILNELQNNINMSLRSWIFRHPILQICCYKLLKFKFAQKPETRLFSIAFLMKVALRDCLLSCLITSEQTKCTIWRGILITNSL